MDSQIKRDGLLRHSLKANGIFSGISGLAFMLGYRPLARVIGLETPIYMMFIGWGLLLFSAALFYLSSRSDIDKRMALLIVGGDLSWVIATGILLIVYPDLLNGTGRFTAMIVAAVVLIFADLQAYGLWRVHKSIPSSTMAS